LSTFDVLQVSRTTFAIATHFGRRVDGDENELGLMNGALHVGGEEEVSSATFSHHFVQSRLWNGEGKNDNKSFCV
jgi:hypothetical protein